MKWIGLTISANQTKGNLIEYLTKENIYESTLKTLLQ